MVTSWSALESHQRALHTTLFCSLTDYISHHSLPGLISTHYHIHLYLIILFSSPHISLVHPFTHCKVLYVVALHFRAFSLISCLLVWFSCLFPGLLFCLWPLPVLFVCLFGLPSCVWPLLVLITILDYASNKAAIGSQPLCLGAVSWHIHRTHSYVM